MTCGSCCHGTSVEACWHGNRPGLCRSRCLEFGQQRLASAFPVGRQSQLISDIVINDCTTKKILKSQYIFKHFILLICLPPNFQNKKWTSARVRALAAGRRAGPCFSAPTRQARRVPASQRLFAPFLGAAARRRRQAHGNTPAADDAFIANPRHRLLPAWMGPAGVRQILER